MIKKWLKCKIAEFLGTYFSKKYCWADLVLWSLEYGVPFFDIGFPTQCGYCQNCMTEKEVEVWVKEMIKNK